jgi:hypothetical protein
MNELTFLELEIAKLFHDGYSKAEVIHLTNLASKGFSAIPRSLKYNLKVSSINGIKRAYSILENNAN